MRFFFFFKTHKLIAVYARIQPVVTTKSILRHRSVTVFCTDVSLQMKSSASGVVTEFTLEKTPAFTNSLMPIQTRDVCKPFAAATTFVWFDFKVVVVYMSI